MVVFGSGFGNKLFFYFWVRNRDFQTSILFPVFNSKLQVWFSFSQLLMNLILSAIAKCWEDFELDFYLGSNPRKFLGRISNPKTTIPGLLKQAQYWNWTCIEYEIANLYVTSCKKNSISKKCIYYIRITYTTGCSKLCDYLPYFHE